MTKYIIITSLLVSTIATTNCMEGAKEIILHSGNQENQKSTPIVTYRKFLDEKVLTTLRKSVNSFFNEYNKQFAISNNDSNNDCLLLILDSDSETKKICKPLHDLIITQQQQDFDKYHQNKRSELKSEISQLKPTDELNISKAQLNYLMVTHSETLRMQSQQMAGFEDLQQYVPETLEKTDPALCKILQKYVRSCIYHYEKIIPENKTKIEEIKKQQQKINQAIEKEMEETKKQQLINSAIQQEKSL